MINQIAKVAEIISEIRNTSSKKEKEEIIGKNKDNELLGDVLHFIFNPYIKTNIAKKKLNKKVSTSKEFVTISTIYDYMDYLKKCSGKDYQISTVQNYINSQPQELRWLFEAIAIKELKIGATSTTINKAFGYDFIPSFDVMLAEKYIETKKVKGVSKVVENWKRYVGKRVIATKKLDGNRCVAIVFDDGSVKLYSREGHELEGFSELKEAFASFPKGFVYDGEILAKKDEGLNSKDLFQKTSKIVKKKGIKTGVEFHAFDLVKLDEFNRGGWGVSCEKRKNALAEVIKRQNNNFIHYVEPLYIGEFDKEKIDALVDEAKKNEEEGIMVQLADAGYECKRCFNILKVKTMESADIRCLDIYEGKSGKNIGRLGGIVCDYKGYRVNVGGGFSDEQRIAFFENPNLIVGKIVEIQYFEEFEDGETGELDLRFPVFKTIRDDKSEPSYY